MESNGNGNGSGNGNGNEHEDLKRKAEVPLIDDDEDEDLVVAKSKHLAVEKEKAGMARHCPYLDTIERKVLDFGKQFIIKNFPKLNLKLL